MANPHHLPPVITAFGRLSALNSPLPWRSGTPSIDQPIHFMARQLAQARSVLRLSTQDLPDFSPDTLSNTIPSKSTMITLFPQFVQGLVTVPHELSRVTQAVTPISQENENLGEELHEISSQLAKLPSLPPHNQQPSQRIADLQACIRDLSHRVSAPIPALHHKPAPTHEAPPPPTTSGPPSSKKGKERARAPPTLHPAAAEDPNTSYHSTIGDLARHW